MLLTVLADGQLRLYDAAPSGEVDEWARVRVGAGLSPEALVRLSLDLAHLAVNGHGIAGPGAPELVEAELAVEPVGRVVAEVPPYLGPRQEAVLELLVQAGRPLRAAELAQALDVPGIVVSSALYELSKKGLVHKVPPQRWSAVSEQRRASSGSATGLRRSRSRDELLAELGAGPGTTHELAARVGRDVRRVRDQLARARRAGLVTSAGGRWVLVRS